MFLDFLKKKGRKHENAEIEMIEDILAKNKIDFDISEVYKVGGTVYESGLLDKIREKISAKDLNDLMELKGIDVTRDLIEIYLLVDDRGKNILLGIIDPYELYDNPTLIAYTRDIDCNFGLLKEKRIM